jgi:hypothetical protein
MWVSQGNTRERVVQEALGYFRSNNFQYTLNPPFMEKDPVDTFLFEKRKGYCGHYASAFAFLMRAAGIPARVVVGYLGGERNPYADYLIVRQYHAHAWAEVFFEDKGWVRIDPTLAVAPERVTLGLAESLVPEELPDFLNRTKLGQIGIYWEKARFMWDAVNLRWNAWLMEYSGHEQRGLWTRLLKGIWLNKIWILICCSLLAMASGAVLFYRHRNSQSGSRRDPVVAAYGLFCRKLERAGIKRAASQGPRDFGQHVGVLRSDLRIPVNEIIQHYIDLRYASKGDAASAKKFSIKIKRFHPENLQHNT